MQRDTRGDPFIIWTLRRTGGTNLASHLFQISRRRGTQHEPFNGNRIFGHVRRDVLNTGDPAPLDRICADGTLIKHCVEAVPAEFSRLLMERSTLQGYRHLFLIRQDPADRLLSLHFARASGAWGVRKVAERNSEELARIMRETPIPIDKLVAGERADRDRLRAVYMQALQAGARPLIAVFEDLYDSAAPVAALARLERLKTALGIDTATHGNEADRETLFGGGQRTRDIYTLAPNHDAFRRTLADMEPMTLGTAVPASDRGVRAKFETHPGCRLDPPRLSWRSDLVQLTGTLEPRDGWRAELAGGTVLPIVTDASQRFAVLDIPHDAMTGLQLVRQSSSAPSQ